MRILLVRLDGIGDALACTPLVAALRNADHELGVALTHRNGAIFARETFAWTHILERRTWPKHGHTAGDVERTVTEARAIGYHLALVATEEPDGYVLAQRCAPRRVGFVNGWEKPLKSFFLRRRLTRALVRPASPGRIREHEVQTLFALGEGLTGEVEPTRDTIRLRPLVVDADGSSRRAKDAYVALQLTPKWGALGIDRLRLARLAQGLREIAAVRLLASAADAALVRAVGELLAGDPAIDATVFDGEEGMRAWKRAIADAFVLVTPDSGAAHVAGMCGTPCVDVFPNEPLAQIQMRRWAPWAAPNALLVAGPHASIVAAARELSRR